MSKKTQNKASNEPIKEIINALEEEPKKYGTRGTFSEELLNRNKETEEEIELRKFKELNTFKKDGEILWGTVIGAEKFDKNGSPVCYANVLWNGISVMIPDEFYFSKDFKFGTTYDSGTDEEKFKRRRQQMSYNFGATVCFCVVGVSRTKITDGQFAGQYTVSAVGNRVMAMEKLQDIFFFHKNRKTKQVPITIKKGDIATNVHVLGVKEDMVTVECWGVETRLDAYQLSNQYVMNCNDFCKPGDELELTVKNIEIKDGKVYLRLTGRTFDTSKNIVSMKEGSHYFGTVTAYKKDRDMYVVTLLNGVIANVYGDKVEGGIGLTVGDRVAVYVYGINTEYVVGTARRC